MMLNYILKPVVHQSFYKKYASKKYLKVWAFAFDCRLSLTVTFQASVYVREWALERWEENARVDLVRELPTLKALIRETNEREQAIVDAAGHLVDGTVETTAAEDTYA
jgi:hypothetical protein